MLKRNQILTMGMLLLLVMMSYIITNYSDIKDPLNTNKEIETPSIIDSAKPTEEPRYIRQLKFAYEGRMSETKPIIGKNVEQYLDDSFDMYYFLGGLAHDNGDMQLLTNGYLDDNNTQVYGDIVVIIKGEAYGIKTGMTMGEVNNALGEPDKFIEFDSDISELYNNNSIFMYNTGDYQVVIVFHSEDKTVIAVHLNGFQNNLGYHTSEEKIDLLDLSQEEIDAYNRFKSSYDEEELRGLEPLSLMKLYIHAIIEKDYETQWELYIKDENYLGWDKAHHMSIPDSDRITDFSVFQNAVNIKVNYYDDQENTSISWEDKYLEEYDNSGYPFKFGFSLVKNKDGIWKVSFLPMQ